MLLRFDNGAKGVFSVGQVCAGHKNDLAVEVCGASGSLGWRQEHQNELWIGRRDERNARAAEGSRAARRRRPALRASAGRASGKLGRRVLQCHARHLRRHRRGRRRPPPVPPAFATFEDGYRANVSWTRFSRARARAASGRRSRTDAMDNSGVRAAVHEGRHPDRRPSGADAARGARSRSRSRHRGLARVRAGDLAPTTSSCPPRSIPPKPTSRPKPCSIRSPTRSTCASRSTRHAPSACRRRSSAHRRRLLGPRLFRQHAPPRPAVRKKKHEFMRRVFDAAALLGVNAVCGFVGRNQQLSMDQNLLDFEEQFIPLLKEAKSRGLTYRVEQCPMPGWTTGDNFHNNIAYTPGTWIALHRICENARRRRPVPDPLRPVARDPDGAGHAVDFPVPEGRRLRLPHRRLPRERAGDRRAGSRGVGLRRADDRARRLERRRRLGRTGRSGQCVEETDVLCEHELPGTARHDPLAYLQNRTVDWLDHQLAARELLPLDVANTPLIVEHEFPKARIQDRERLKPILQGSIAFIRAHRRGGGLHVRAAAGSAAGAGDSGPGHRTGAVPKLIHTGREQFETVSQSPS